MEVPGNSTQSWRAAFTGCYDDEEIDLLERHIEPGTMVLDIGASLGFYTVPLAAFVQRSGGRVVAFEPVKANCDVLRRNLELNGLNDFVDVVPLALGAGVADVDLHVESGGAGNATIVTGLDASEVARHDKEGGTSATEKAHVVPLDEMEALLSKSGLRCSLMKIDAEGYEPDVLAGARQFIEMHRPVILAEFHPEWLLTRGFDADAPRIWATKNSYSCSELVYMRTRKLIDRQQITVRPLSVSDQRSGTSLLLTP